MVVNDSEVRVADPGVNQFLVEGDGLLLSLVSSFIIGVSVESLCAVSTRDHVDHCLVALVAQVNRAPAGLIKQGLPDVFVRVRHAVHDSAVADEHCLGV